MMKKDDDDEGVLVVWARMLRWLSGLECCCDDGVNEGKLVDMCLQSWAVAEE